MFTLEFVKLFLAAGRFGHLQYVETHSLGQGPAFTDIDNVASGHITVENENQVKIKVALIVGTIHSQMGSGGSQNKTNIPHI